MVMQHTDSNAVLNLPTLSASQCQRREALLQTAIGVYCHYGYYGTTLSKVAEAAGVSKALVIKYFGSMETLAKLCLRQVCQKLIPQPDHPESRYPSYAEYARDSFDHIRENRLEWRFLLGLCTVPALSRFRRDLAPRLMGRLHRAASGFEGDLADPGDSAVLSHLMTAHSLAYVTFGNAELSLRARDWFLPHFLRDPGSYEPLRFPRDILREPSNRQPLPPPSPIAGPQKLHRRDARREEIIQAALKVFGHYGYYGATMDAIALAAGVSRTLVVNYCGSFQETALLCVRRFLEMTHQQMWNLLKKAGHSHNDVLELLRYNAVEWRFVAGMLLTPSLEEMMEPLRAQYRDLLRPLTQVFCQDGIAPDRVPDFTYSMTALSLLYIMGGDEEAYLQCQERLFQIALCDA